MPITPETEMPRVRYVEVERHDAGQRIDNYLHRTLKGVPRARVYRSLRRGEVRVNGRRVRAQYRVQAGDRVRLPPLHRRLVKKDPRLQGELIQRLSTSGLFEDDAFLVINKPAGLAVHGGSGLSFGVIEALRALRPDARYLELAHRLDRGTSGCLVLAKKRSALRSFHEALRRGDVVKRYLALLRGHWPHGEYVADFPLQMHHRRGGERTVTVDSTGKASRSTFRLVQHLPGVSLVEVEISTGRTHQIRVHASHLGFPLAGDSRYGDPAFNTGMSRYGLTRVFLHAHVIEFPSRNQTCHISAPLAPDLCSVIDSLETVDSSQRA